MRVRHFAGRTPCRAHALCLACTVVAGAVAGRSRAAAPAHHFFDAERWGGATPSGEAGPSSVA
eukprot:10516549-Alexandrium_andersonii.AAC.1